MVKLGHWVYFSAALLVFSTYWELRGSDHGCLVTGSGAGVDGFYAAQPSASSAGGTVWVRSGLALARVPDWIELTRLPVREVSSRAAGGHHRPGAVNAASFMRLEAWADGQPTFVLRNAEGDALFAASANAAGLAPQPLADGHRHSDSLSNRRPPAEALLGMLLGSKPNGLSSRNALPPTHGWRRVRDPSGDQRLSGGASSALSVAFCSASPPVSPRAAPGQPAPRAPSSANTAVVQGVPVGGRGGGGGLWSGGGSGGGAAAVLQLPATGVLIAVNLGV